MENTSRKQRKGCISELATADELLEQGNIQIALQHYLNALVLQPESETIRDVLIGIATNKKFNWGNNASDVFRRLKSSLLDTKDIMRLQGAIADAENYKSKDLLSPQILELLRQSKLILAEIMAEHYEIHAMIMSQDVYLVKESQERLSHRLVRGERFFFDPTTNTIRPLYEILRECQIRLDEQSNESVQRFMEVIELLIPKYPLAAKFVLEYAMKKPMTELHHRLLTEKLTEIDLLTYDDKAISRTSRKRKL